MARHFTATSTKSTSSSTHMSTIDATWRALLALSMGMFCYLVFMTKVHLNPPTSPSPPSSNNDGKDRYAPSSATPRHPPERHVGGTAIGHGDPSIFGGSSSRTAPIEDQTTTTTLTDEEETFRFIPRKKRRHRKRRQSTNVTNVDDGNGTAPVLNLTGTPWDLEETAMMPNVSNLVYYRNVNTANVDGNHPRRNLWDDDPSLPQWMKDYFTWHQWKREHWDLTNWKSERWLVMQCLMEQDPKKCGGTSDRLKPFPVLLKIAYQSKRILLIRWTRPATLEEFLVPPRGGFDWRVPPPLVDVLNNATNGKRVAPIKLVKLYSERGVSMLRTRYQTATAQMVYNSIHVEDDEPNFHTVFPHVWRYFFTPSPPVAAMIERKMAAMGLVPNGYVAAHLRALYAVEQVKTWYIQMFTENALACATELRPGVPIFFASDSADATAHAVSIGGGQVRPKYGLPEMGSAAVAVKIPPVHSSVPDPNPPWHLDMYVGPPFKFYDTFVDLYLMALAGCVTYNKGGYGNWALLIGGNLACGLEQEVIGRAPTISNPCHFRDEMVTVSGTEQRTTVTRPLYLPPMEDGSTRTSLPEQ